MVPEMSPGFLFLWLGIQLRYTWYTSILWTQWKFQSTDGGSYFYFTNQVHSYRNFVLTNVKSVLVNSISVQKISFRVFLPSIYFVKLRYVSSWELFESIWDLFMCKNATLNFSMGFNIVAPFMVCATHEIDLTATGMMCHIQSRLQNQLVTSEEKWLFNMFPFTCLVRDL